MNKPTPRLIATGHRIAVLASVALFFVSISAVWAGQPTYLSQAWFHKADNINLLNTPEGHRLAVDNAGRFIADQSLIPENRNIKFTFDSLTEHEGEYYLGRYLGNHGYDWIPIGTRDRLIGGKALLEAIKNPLFRTTGYHLDHDPMRGDAGMAIFPKAGSAMVCGQSQWDSRTFQITRMRQGDAAPDKNEKIEIPIYASASGSVRTEDFADRVFIDRAGKGFWYLGSQETDDGRKLALAFVRPTKKADGSATITLSKIIAIGTSRVEKFEAGVVVGDKLFLLIAKENRKIGGVEPTRRLIRIDRTMGKVAEANVTFDCHIDDVRIAAMGKNVALRSPDMLRLIDGETLKEKWSKDAAAIAAPYTLAYNIARIVGKADGSQLAVGLATDYRKPGELTRVHVLNTQGKTEQRWELNPGSIDELVFTPDGGLMVFSAQYTARLGGTVNIKANEAASIARTRKALTPKQPKPRVEQTPRAYLDAPLRQRHKVWFDKPTKGFGTASLPLGNGHLGAMLSGGTDRANIVLNVDSMWEGSETRMASYQGFGEISVILNHDPKKVTDYRRELDVRTGLYTVTYKHAGVTYKREAFCSYPHGLLGIRFSADKQGAYSGDVELLAMHEAKFRKGADGIEFAGKLKNHRKFKCVMKLQADGGRVLPEAGKNGERTVKYRRYKSVRPFNTVRVEGANSITLYVAGDTDYSLDPADKFRGTDPAKKIAPRLAHIRKHSFDAMAKASAADVSALFDRCTLELATNNPTAEALPIDKRKDAYRSGNIDPGFEALVFDAQRYMMIACSRPGSLPANLQGMWNNSNWPAWTSDYHTDINIQMNYWFVEPANLAECATPLFDYIESQIPVWRTKAKQTFGNSVRGWTVAYMNNIDGGWSYKNFPPGGAWLAWHYAEHFKFNQDRAYLEKRAYPVLRELSEHWQDLLIRRPDGKLTTPRTMSPEHKPPQFGISQDVQMVHNLFTDFIAASRRLDCDADFRTQVTDMRNCLIPMKIGRWGQLQEWERDRDNRYCTHRHIQHLFAAFPDNRIDAENTPELARAAVTSLEARGTGRSGWSQVWRINIFARLGRHDLAYRQIRKALPGFHNHLIWQSKNQVDAPCGYASGVCEMLLQSHQAQDDRDSHYVIHLLPALPAQWPTGRVKGLRARGGFEVDIEWTDGQLTAAKLRNVSAVDEKCVIRYKGEIKRINIPRGEAVAYPIR